MKKKVLSLILCCVIAFGFNSVQAFAAESASEIQNEINKNNDKIDSLQDQKNKVQSDKNEQNSQLKAMQDQLDSKINDLKASQAKVDEYQSKIDTLQGKINSIQSNINKVANDIDTVEKNIEQKKQEEVEKKELLGRRLRTAYKTNIGEQILGVVLGSNNLNDFLTKLQTMAIIIEKDNELIEEVKNIEKDLSQKEKDLSVKKADLNSQKSQVLVEQDKLKDIQQSLIQQRNENKLKYDELNSLKSQKNSLIASLNDSEKQIEEKISDLQEDNVDLSGKFQNANSVGSGTDSSKGSNSGNVDYSDSGYFKWPASGGITDPFGWRIHPIKHTRSFHTGVDIGASMGSPVVAAKGGTVALVETNDLVYGHMIIINHGNGFQTMYGHMSGVNVSVGQKVSKGQVIGRVGSEGIYSTGPHLHLEIRKDGQPVNPLEKDKNNNYIYFSPGDVGR